MEVRDRECVDEALILICNIVVVPIYKVDLDDVLQRKHLPPLG